MYRKNEWKIQNENAFLDKNFNFEENIYLKLIKC